MRGIEVCERCEGDVANDHTAYGYSSRGLKRQRYRRPYGDRTLRGAGRH